MAGEARQLAIYDNLCWDDAKMRGYWCLTLNTAVARGRRDAPESHVTFHRQAHAP
jgi:hypothetical protein